MISRSELLKEINDLNSRIAKARELLLNGDIDGADYKTIKSENEYKINVLEAKLAEAAAVNSKAENIEPILRRAITKLTQLNTIYSKSNTSAKRELIGSMYPQKFTFEELQHRTALQVNYSCIYLINRKIAGKKEGQATDFSCLPILAPEPGLEPGTL
ncbi:hypothetical protein [Mucilaginibacter gilvus]|uniref:Uncharacterized protein n=1 Tax=Mucilaginibacter gilvus TaxID=2305909 RepID=A0A3S3VWB0_9SPHI|nr:hypothetical protein [Mucilaginibacter gilvus]RWY57526.1 hypothetical protein EPL05_03075 [Mucilaginibacter gilvus]